MLSGPAANFVTKLEGSYHDVNGNINLDVFVLKKAHYKIHHRGKKFDPLFSVEDVQKLKELLDRERKIKTRGQPKISSKQRPRKTKRCTSCQKY